MAHWQLGNAGSDDQGTGGRSQDTGKSEEEVRGRDKDEARKWYDRAVQWMEKNQDQVHRNKQWLEELRLFRAETEDLLGIEDSNESQKQREGKTEGASPPIP
jgi:hypothetical protein